MKIFVVENNGTKYTSATVKYNIPVHMYDMAVYFHTSLQTPK